MNYVYSSMSKEQYLKTLKQKFGNPLYVFDERLTGMVIGPFFSVAHYQPYEWNRRITGECNRAWGIVKEFDGELEICFLRGKGWLAPGWLLVWTLICRLMVVFMEFQSGKLPSAATWLICILAALVTCASKAIADSLTEEGEAGIREINRLLENPTEYYG